MGGEEAAAAKIFDDFERGVDEVDAELRCESGDGDALVETETEEPSFFVLTIWREPGSLGRLRGFEICGEIVGSSRTENVAGFV